MENTGKDGAFSNSYKCALGQRQSWAAFKWVEALARIRALLWGADSALPLGYLRAGRGL